MSDSDARRDDEVVSAYLDGEATADERARVENDPRLQARLVELRRAATAVGTPHFFADSPGRDELIARALTAADPATGLSSASAPVADLDAARRRRRRLTVLSAAAAVVVLVLAVPLLDRGARTATTDLAGRASDTALTEDDADVDAAPEANGTDDTAPAVGPDVSTPPQLADTSTTMGQEPPTTAAATQLAIVDLGSFESRAGAQLVVTDAIDEALLAVNVEGAADELGLPGRLSGAGDQCDTQILADDPELGALVYAASFELPDGEHLVLVYSLVPNGAVNGSHRIYEVLLPACTPVGDETI